MTTIVAHITVKAGHEAAFEAIARDLYQASHAGEQGLLRYEYWRGATERTYYTLLAFRDHRAFIVHQTSDAHEAASPALGSVIEALRLEFVDPVDGAAPLPPTEHQPAPADADELTLAYTARFAARVPDWWRSLRGAGP
jgi:quinol monooxygenase YgiN